MKLWNGYRWTEHAEPCPAVAAPRAPVPCSSAAGDVPAGPSTAGPGSSGAVLGEQASTGGPTLAECRVKFGGVVVRMPAAILQADNPYTVPHEAEE